MMLKVDYDRLLQEFLDTGMHPSRAKELTKQIRQDMLDWPEMYESLDSCRWLLEHGFVPGRLKMYGENFNEETYRDYYPDFDYFMAHPMNNHFNIWINDKLTLKYMLNSAELAHYMPEYYLYIENDGHYSYLMDAPEDIVKDKDFLYNLLASKKHLAVKPSRGAGGKNFYNMRFIDGEVTVNGEVIKRGDFDGFVKRELNGFIVTQFIEQSREIENIYEGTDCALRIILYKKVSDDYAAPPDYGCLIAYARFGTSRSNHASNLCHGGLAVRVDWDTGKFVGKYRGNAEFWGAEGAAGFDRHPDTGEIIDGKTIPHWEKVKDGLIRICRYLSSLDYFGMDVIVTEDDFMLCEINSAPSTGFGQFHSGKCCLDNDDARRFAASKTRPYKKNLIECFLSSLIE